MPIQFPHPKSGILPHQIQTIDIPSNTGSVHQEKIVSSLLGLAVGDALGASVEFRPHQYLVEHPVKDFQNGGTWGLNAGQWTDDTSMALCLASSLIIQQDFNPYDQMVRYKWWYKDGFLSSTGKCFDIGQTTRASLEEFIRRQNRLKQSFPDATDEDIDNMRYEQIKKIQQFDVYCGKQGDAGNGPLMRLAPVPLFYFRTPVKAVELAGRSAILTHGDQKAADACRYYAALIVAAINGEPKKNLLSTNFYEEHRSWFGHNELHPEVLNIAKGSYRKRYGYDDGIRGTNYIISTLEAALWAFFTDGDSFNQGALNAVNLGDDTDTTAAIYGQLAGAYYGRSGIPGRWLQQLYAQKQITCIGDWIYFLGSQATARETQQRIPTQNQLNTSVSLPIQRQNIPSTTYTTSQSQKGYYGYGTQSNHNKQPTNRPTGYYQTYGHSQSGKQDASQMRPAGMPSGGFKQNISKSQW